MISAFVAWEFRALSLAQREVPFFSFQPLTSRFCWRIYAAWCPLSQSAYLDLRRVFCGLGLLSVEWYSWVALFCQRWPSRLSAKDASIGDQRYFRRQIISERHQSPWLLDQMGWIHLAARKWGYQSSRYLPCSCIRLQSAPQGPHTMAFHNWFLP